VLDVVREELNVKAIGFAGSVDELGRWHAKPNFKVLGPRLGPDVKLVAAALGEDDGALASALAHGEEVRVAVGGREVSLAPSDVDLTQDVAEGYGIASDGGVTVALALELTDDLRREGLARELVRLVQDARKAGGLDVSDRIDLGVEVSGAVAAALAAHRDEIAAETLALSVQDAALSGGYRQDAEIEGEPVAITVRMAIPTSS
jgi:isoleucyl-tRNA synthetase